MHRRRLSAVLALLITACSTGGGGGGAPDPFEGLTAERTLSIPGLEGRTEVLRDAYGVAHIFCQHEIDCVRAQGYVQAHDRLFEMDFYRMLATGRLGYFLGTLPGVRDTDREYRRAFTAADGRPVAALIEEGLDPDVRAFLEAFAEGVNAYIDDLGEPWAPISDEYGHFLVLNGQDLLDGRAKPLPWTVQDTLSVARFFSWSLSQSAGNELRLASYASKLDPKTFADLVPLRPMDPTFIVPGFYGSGHLGRGFRLSDAASARMHALAPSVDAALARLDALGRFEKPLGTLPGSNNWIVDAAHSATGHVLVADDPHLSLLSPSIWWEVHMDAVSLPGADGTMQVEGTIFPGTPGVIIGHTQHIGWAVTVVGYDVTDFYTEQVTGVDKVRFKDQDVDVIKAVVRYPRGPDLESYDEEKICVVPQHGPILTAPAGMSAADFADPGKPCVDPAVSTTALSMKWTGQRPTYEVSTVYQLLHATNVDGARDAIDDFGVGAQNWVVGDTDGHIIYYPHADVPVRDGDLYANPPWLPLPGDGRYEWIGYVPKDELPQATDPARGFVVTANNDAAGVTEDDDPLNDPHYLIFTMDLGLRAGRITRRLQQAIDDHGLVTVDDMKSIQNDSHYELAEWVVPYLLAAADAAPEEVAAFGVQDAIARLKAWSFDAPTGLAGWDPDGPPSEDPQERADAIATTIFSAWWPKAMDHTFLDELKAAGVVGANATQGPTDQPFEKALYFALAGTDDTYFDDVSTEGVVETRAQTLLAALADAVQEIETRLGSDPERWLWGRLHVVPFPSPFGATGLDDPSFPMRTVANDGGAHTIDVANYGRDFRQSDGPSMRHVTNMDPAAVESYFVIPGGEIDYLGHPNREDQLDLWLNGEYRRPAFSLESAVEAAKARDAAMSPGARWTFER